jgi:predicted lipase
LPASTANMRAALALQGGSVAAILAVELAAAPPGQRMSAPTLVTFGEPRTGDAAFADAVTALIPNAQRVVHNRDIIPHYPFREMPSTARNGSVYKYHLVLCFETYKC